MMKWKEEIQAVLLSSVGGARYGIKIRLPHAVVMTCLFRNDLSSSQKLKQIIQLVQEHGTNLALFAALYKSILLLLKILSNQTGKKFTTNNQYPVRTVEYLQYCGRMLISLLVDGKMSLPMAGDGQHNASTTSPATPPSPSTPQTTTTTIQTMSGVGYPQYPHHALIAGLIGGYTIWGRYTSINYQIVLYLTSRVIVALFQRQLAQATTTATILQQQSTDSVPAQKPSTRSSIIDQQFLKDRLYSFSAATVWGIVMYLFEDSPEFLHPSLKSSMDEIYRYQCD